MTSRRPSPARAQHTIPTLSAWLALGFEVAGCHEPACGPSRQSELAEHGAHAATFAQNFNARETVRELAVGVGLAAHPPSPAVQVPPIDPELNARPYGGPMMLDPTPPSPPPRAIEGDGRAVLPHPPNAPPATRPAPLHRPPPPRPIREPVQIDGDPVSVGPTPADGTTVRPPEALPTAALRRRV